MVGDFLKNYTEYKNCNSKGSLKRFCDNKQKISNQQKNTIKE